jgi:ferredoxin-type protein NapH
MTVCPVPGSRRRLTAWRRRTQLAFALLFVMLPFGGARGFTAVAGTLGAVQIGPIDLIEPAAALSAVLAGLSITTTLVIGAGLLILLAIVLGPVFCSWVCPWSLISEWLDTLRYRGARRLWTGVNSRGTTRLRWGVFAGLLAASALIAAPIASLVSGPRLITTLPLELIHLHRLSWVTGGLLFGMLALEWLGPRRIWCRALCPAGAAARLVRTPRTLGPVYDDARCADPRLPLCLLSCPWGLDPRQMRLTDGCTTCLACVDACGTHALVTGFGPVGMQRPAAPATARPRAAGDQE